MKYQRVAFGKLPPLYYGMYYVPTDEIVLDLRKDVNILKIFLHELIHRRYPRASERWVRGKTKRLWKQMSPKEKWELGKQLFLDANFTYR